MEHLQPKESLQIIQRIINERKQKYEQNGILFIFWGILIVLASVFNHFTGNYAIWAVLMPLGAVITFIYYFIKGIKSHQKGVSTDWTGYIWGISGLCAMYAGFVLTASFEKNQFVFLNIIIYLPFIFAAIASALSLKNGLWLSTSLLAICVVFLSLNENFSSWKIQTLFPAVIAILIYLIPGIQMFISFKKRKK